MAKFQPNALNYGTLHNTYTDTHHTSHYTNTQYQSSYTDILPVSKNTRSYERNYGGQRNNLELKRKQLKYHQIILEWTQQQFSEEQKISFLDDDKDSGEW